MPKEVPSTSAMLQVSTPHRRGRPVAHAGGGGAGEVTEAFRTFEPTWLSTLRQVCLEPWPSLTLSGQSMSLGGVESLLRPISRIRPDIL